MFDGLQILSNTFKHYPANSTKQGQQTVKCLVTKQCNVWWRLVRNTFLVCSGLQEDAASLYLSFGIIILSFLEFVNSRYLFWIYDQFKLFLDIIT